MESQAVPVGRLAFFLTEAECILRGFREENASSWYISWCYTAKIRKQLTQPAHVRNKSCVIKIRVWRCVFCPKSKKVGENLFRRFAQFVR